MNQKKMIQWTNRELPKPNIWTYRAAGEGSGLVAVVTYLHPLPVGLHVEDNAGVGFGQSISVWDAFTGETQLHFGQTGTAEQTQRVGRWLVDVAHGGGGTGSLHEKESGSWISQVHTQYTQYCRELLQNLDCSQAFTCFCSSRPLRFY